MFKILFRLVSLGLFIAPFALVMLAIERTPLVMDNEEARFDDIGDAKDILKRFDPRMMDANTTTKVSVTDDEISMAIGAALSRFSPIKGRVFAAEDGVAIRGTMKLPIPDTFLGRYVNVEAVVAPSDSELVVSRLSVGAVGIPSWIIKPATVYALDWFMGVGKGEPTYASVRSVAVDGNRIIVAFQPPPNLFADVKAAARRVTQIDNVESVRAYAANLIDTGRRGEQSLAPYLRNAFTLAKERSRTKDPVEENRALILALALQFGDPHFGILLSGVQTSELAAADFDNENVTIQNRHDWVQHFTTSAGLQIAANSGISDFIGVAKEIKDSQTSSGFSFGDLAADRTGVRLAEVATASAESARRVQDAFADLSGESHFFPKAIDLPEDLTEAQFKARFGDVDTPEYESQVRTIDQRIAKIAVYK